MNTNLQSHLQAQIIPLLKKYGVKKAAFFGSLVDGSFDEKKSDIDILVMPPEGTSLLDFSGLYLDIEDAIHKEVDLVTYNGISRYLKDSILKGQKVFYEA